MLIFTILLSLLKSGGIPANLPENLVALIQCVLVPPRLRFPRFLSFKRKKKPQNNSECGARNSECVSANTKFGLVLCILSAVKVNDRMYYKTSLFLLDGDHV